MLFQSVMRELGQLNGATEPLAVLAWIALAQGNTAEALAQIVPVLVQLESGSLEEADEPLRIDLTCYQVLRVAKTRAPTRCWSAPTGGSRSKLPRSPTKRCGAHSSKTCRTTARS
jgi:hypothetical protein